MIFQDRKKGMIATSVFIFIVTLGLFAGSSCAEKTQAKNYNVDWYEDGQVRCVIFSFQEGSKQVDCDWKEYP